MSEAQEQKAVIEWCNWNSNRFEELKWIFHCPNEAKRNKRTGAELKRLGMKAGVPDLLLLVPNGGYRHPAEAKKLKATGTKRGVPDLFLPVARNGKHGLYIEMKYGKNKCTIEQVKWLDWLYKQGYMCKVCWSSEEAIAVIKEYLGVK